MNSLIISLNAVFPVFVLILLGMLLRRIGLMNDITTAQLNRILFVILMPVLLFNNIYNTETGDVFHPRLIVYCLGGVAVSWIIVSVLVCIPVKEMRTRGAMIQGISRSNFILFGLPIVSNMVSKHTAGVTSIVAAFIVPLFNFLSVITLEIFRHEKIHLGKILKGIVKNPLIIGSLLGVAALFSGVRFPEPIENVLNTVSGMSSPIGLIIMGAALQFDKIRGNRLVLSISVISKLVLIPLVGISLGILIGFRGIDLLTVTTLFAAPTAVSSYPMAVEMDSDSDLACQIVVFTTLFSCLTNFIFLYLINMLGLI